MAAEHEVTLDVTVYSIVLPSDETKVTRGLVADRSAEPNGLPPTISPAASILLMDGGVTVPDKD